MKASEPNQYHIKSIRQGQLTEQTQSSAKFLFSNRFFFYHKRGEENNQKSKLIYAKNNHGVLISEFKLISIRLPESRKKNEEFEWAEIIFQHALTDRNSPEFKQTQNHISYFITNQLNTIKINHIIWNSKGKKSWNQTELGNPNIFVDLIFDHSCWFVDRSLFFPMSFQGHLVRCWGLLSEGFGCCMGSFWSGCCGGRKEEGRCMEGFLWSFPAKMRGRRWGGAGLGFAGRRSRGFSHRMWSVFMTNIKDRFW